MNNELIDLFVKYFRSGNNFGTITEARQFAAQQIGQPVSPGSALAKSLDESLEAALIRVARRLVETSPSPEAGFDALVDLYQRQPRLGVRSSTSIRQQAYSTPIPIAYLASILARITPETSIYEPTAGHGALILAATPSLTYANELNPERAEDLRQQGFRVTEQDATSFLLPEQVDVVIANPPFGRLAHQSWQVRAGPATRPYRTTQIDHAIAFKSLEALKDEGSAVLILASPLANKLGDTAAAASSYNGSQNRAFYKSLYENYQVTQHLCIAGELYARQGTTFPIDIVVIQGRGRSERELPAVDVPKVYTQFEELQELIDDEVSRAALLLESRSRPGSGIDSMPERSTDPEPGDVSGGTLGTSGLADRARRGHEARGAGHSLLDGAEQSLSGELADRAGFAERMGRSGDPVQLRASAVPENPLPSIPLPATALQRRQQDAADGKQLGRVDGADGRLLSGVGLTMTDTEVIELQEIRQVPYQPQSGAKAVDTLVPVNMQSAIRQALEKLEQQSGNLDAYVAARLGIENRADLYQRFSAEQIDGLALAYSNLAKGESFIIGDQTGVGKGRMVAAILEYARQRDLIPVFVTEKFTLYTDMFRDLYDIDARSINPLITNPDMRIERPDGTRLRTNSAASHQSLIQSLLEQGDIGSYNAVFTTYSQLQTVRGQETERRALLRAIAPMSLLVLDESHNAGGSEQTGYQGQSSVLHRADFVRELVQRSAGVVYSSATYAKNPYVMSLYASRTGMRQAVDNPANLVGMIQAGGVPLQQVLAAKLTEAGQYIRRERSYEGIEFAAKVVPVDHPMAEKLAAVMSKIMEFDRAKENVIKGMDRELKKEAKSVSLDNSTGAAGASSTLFTSTMHNVISQTLLAMKAEATVQEAIAALERGEKPVIAVSNTMGSVIGREATNQELQPGDPIQLSVGDLLRRYLERSRDIQTKDYLGKHESRRLSDAELAGDALSLYQDCTELINNTDWSGVPISPIDHIRQRLTQAGYGVDELTGRTDRIEYGPSGEQTYLTRNDAGGKNRTQVINGFNSGKVDVLILNRSSATGISLHASERFSDQRPRRMIIAQPELDINQFMQMLGRIHRTGQVEKPRFTFLMGDIPAEKRPAAILLKKLASLNANTTAARESGFNLETVPDFMNAYGDQVVLELMLNRPDIHSKLGYPIKDLSEDADLETIAIDGMINKITGRIPLLPIAAQEEVYGLIEQSYMALLERERAMGTSILEAETLDLDAQVLAKLEVFPAIGKDENPFTEAVYLEVMDVKAQRKPMTTLQVVNAVRDELGLPSVSDLADHEPESIPGFAQQKFQATLTHLQERTSAYQQGYALRLKAEASEDKTQSIESKVAKLEEKAKHQVARIAGFMQDFPIGQTVWVVNERTASTHYGVIQGYQSQGGAFHNPAIPSNWTMLIQVADATRKLAMPLSKVNSSFESGLKVEPVQHTFLGQKDIYALFDERQSLAREVRQIFTGNVVRAYEKFQGRLINFSDQQGQVRQGLLMPASFELDKTLASQPVQIPTAEQAVGFMNQYRAEIQTRDSGLKIRPDRQDGFVLITSPGHQGDSYFLDSAFLEAMGTEFYSVSDRMEAIVAADRITASLEYLMTVKGTHLFVHQQKEAAREFLGIQLPKVEALDLATSLAPVEAADLGTESPQHHEQANEPKSVNSSVNEPQFQSWTQWRQHLVQDCLIPEQYVDALHQVGLITDEGYSQRPFSQMGLGIKGDQQGFWFQIGKSQIGRVAIADNPLEALALAAIDKRSPNHATIYLVAESLPDALHHFSRQGSLYVASGNHQQGETHAWTLAQRIPSIERLRPQSLSWSAQLLNQPNTPNQKDWPRIAQATGHSQDYLKRIQAVITQPLSEKALTAFHNDAQRFSQIQNSLWNWLRAAQSVGRSPDYVQRIVAVAQAFHSDQPQPLSEQALTAMQNDLNAHIQRTNPQLAQISA